MSAKRNVSHPVSSGERGDALRRGRGAAGAVIFAGFALIGLAGCATPPGPPPPPLPPPPAPLVRTAPVPVESADPSGARARGTGDRELGALRIGIEGCRVLGLRLDPLMSGRAEVTAEIGPAGEVLWVQVTRVLTLPRAVVTCLADRVRTARFDGRGARMLVRIPVDFTRANAPPEATPAKEQAPPPGVREI